MMRSRQIRSAPSLPPSASSTAFRLSASASLSKSASGASVALLLAPRGRPAGLPNRPFSNGRPGPLAGRFCSEFAAMPIFSVAKRPSRAPSRSRILWHFSNCSMIAVLGGLADVERDLIRTRTAEGRSRAQRGAGSVWADHRSSHRSSRKRLGGGARRAGRLPNWPAVTV